MEAQVHKRPASSDLNLCFTQGIVGIIDDNYKIINRNMEI